MYSDIVIIGAGIVGLSTAYQLLQANPRLKITILEKEANPALHQTGRNSGVIHSGIYYKPGSLKAKNCILGKQLLLQFCEQNQIPTQKLGKVIVANSQEELHRLKLIEERGLANLVKLKRINSSELKTIEPHVQALEAIWIPECSIVSYKTVAEKIAENLQQLGCQIFYGHQVKSIKSEKNLTIITDKDSFFPSLLINCAGLFSDKIASMALGKEKVAHRIFPFRGEYYELSEEKKYLVNGLIYPVPDPRFPFLGVHLTRMIDGNVEAGPNAILALAREGYRKRDVDLKQCLDFLSFPGFWKMAAKYWKAGFYEIARSLSKKLFLRDLQKLVPDIEEKDLVPGNCGIRAQMVTRDGSLFDDFNILEGKNMIHILNAPSPAATASFAIGKHIAERSLLMGGWQ